MSCGMEEYVMKMNFSTLRKTCYITIKNMVDMIS